MHPPLHTPSYFPHSQQQTNDMLRSYLAYFLIATQVAPLFYSAALPSYTFAFSFPHASLTLLLSTHAPTKQQHVLTDKVDFNHGRDALAFSNDPANQPWALKDPRLCVTLKFWLPYWTKPPAVLFVYRHPVEVAKSLSRQNEYGGARGIYMWIAHNRLAIQNSQGLCRVVTSDADLIQDGPGTLYMVYSKLRECGVDVPHMATTESINSFIDPNLRHHTAKHAEDCHRTAPKVWRSDATDLQGKAREEEAYAHAIRVYCALRDGSAFSPLYEWENLEDTLSR